MMKRKVSKSKHLASVMLSALSAVMLAAVVSAQTAPPKAHSMMSPPAKAGHTVAPPSEASIPPEQTAAGGPHSIYLPDAAIQRQMIQLERAKHLLELSSANDPSSHHAVAARHLQSAINELKMQMREDAKAKAVAHNGNPHKAGADTAAVSKK